MSIINNDGQMQTRKTLIENYSTIVSYRGEHFLYVRVVSEITNKMYTVGFPQFG